MKRSLLALDLDGTALQDDHQTFSPRLQAALERAAHQGVSIVPITGRQYAMLPPAVRTGAEWEDLCVLCNGGEIRRLHTGELLMGRYMEVEAVRRLADTAARLDLPVEVSADGLLYLTQESWDLQRRHKPLLRFHLDRVLPARGRVVSTLEEVLGRPELRVDKVNLPYIPEDLRGAVTEALSAVPVSFAWSAGHSAEITHRDATKASGLLHICKLLGIDPADAMAIGDSGNDIPMLRAAGLGVAMGDAPQAVKDASDVVTASNREDGAAMAIERYILAGL